MPVDRLFPSRYAYSHVAVTRGRVAFVSGQIAEDDDNGFVGVGDFEAQIRQVFKNLLAILAKLGVSEAEVAKLNYYVVGLDSERLAIVRAVRDEAFPEALKPASTLVGVAALFSPDALVEVEMVVALPQAEGAVQ